MLKDKLISINDGKATFTMDLKLSDNITKTKDGYLKCENSIFGRTGFQTYLGRELVGMGFGDDELVQVFRDEDDVFSEDSLETFIGKPVTLGHPNVDVTVSNIKDLGKGYILGKPYRDGDNVVGDIMITDEETIRLVEEDKLRELSLGYQTKLIRDEDKVRQTEIYVNHLALVERGRAGTSRIMDEEVNMDKEKLLEALSKSNGNVINITINDVKEEVKEEELEVEETLFDKELEEDGVEVVETNIEDTTEATETEDEVIEDEKEDDGEGEQKEEKENEETMTKDSVKEFLKGLTPEELKEVMNLEDKEQETNITDEMFAKVETVENTVVETTFNDYSQVVGDELVVALQKEVDKFSFNELNKGTNSLHERQNKLNDMKTRSGKDFIKGGK